MSKPKATNAKPAQISVADDDRTALEAIKRRAARYDVHVSGPTVIFRAGLVWLASLDDRALVAAIESLSQKVTPSMLQEHFALWCSHVNDRVCRSEVRLQKAWSIYGFFDERTPFAQRANVDVGTFSYEDRFVHLSTMPDGRVFISGIGPNLEHVAAGKPIPRATQLFPGALATLLSMNEEGADLAARAIVAWLMRSDSAIETVRADVQQHIAQQLMSTTKKS